MPAPSTTQRPMRIDSHQHFWRYDAARDGWITDAMPLLKRDFLPQDLGDELAASGFDASIAVQADQSEAETMFLLDLAKESKDIAGVVGWVDLQAPGVAGRLEHFSHFPKLRGFRHIAQSEPDDHFLVRDEVVRGVAQLRQFGFTFDILIYARQLPAALELVSRVPEQFFVIDHLAKPQIKAKKTEPWAGQLRQLAQNKNVFCKLSGLATEANLHDWKMDDLKPYLEVAFEAFGADRLMFGSDWPVCLLAASYSQVVKMVSDYMQGFPEAHKAGIFGANAIRFYGLKASHHGLAA